MLGWERARVRRRVAELLELVGLPRMRWPASRPGSATRCRRCRNAGTQRVAVIDEGRYVGVLTVDALLTAART
ncbi:MAG: hypothetical protein ACREPA_02950 [Candidatus Dormibacteraceae bacterium]